MKRFWIGFGDIHNQVANMEHIPDIGDAEGIFISGDLTNHGNTASIDRIVDAALEQNSVVYAQIGNMDTAAGSERLEQRGINLHRKGFKVAPGVGVMGVGYSTPTPFSTPSEVSDATIGQWLEETWTKVADCEHVILVVHTPPLETATDRITGGTPVGSKAVREFIEKRQPDVCLTGHIHESKAADTLGRTKIVNPGMLADGGYVKITLEDNELNIELLSVNG